jgi:hypothetical protein
MTETRNVYIETIRQNLETLKRVLLVTDMTLEMALDDVSLERAGISHHHLEDIERALEIATVLHGTILKLSRFSLFIREVET